MKNVSKVCSRSRLHSNEIESINVEVGELRVGLAQDGWVFSLRSSFKRESRSSGCYLAETVGFFFKELIQEGIKKLGLLSGMTIYVKQTSLYDSSASKWPWGLP